MAKAKRKYVQWSKIANAISDILLFAMYLIATRAIGNDPVAQNSALQGALQSLVFIQALYSGNSVSEKFFMARYKPKDMQDDGEVEKDGQN